MLRPHTSVQVTLPALAILVCAGCPPPASRVTTAALERIRVAWPKSLRAQWEQRLRDTNWMRQYLLVGVLASRKALDSGLPKQLSLHVQVRRKAGNWTVYFGRLATDGSTFVATHRADVAGGRTRFTALPKPRVLPEPLAAQARAVRTARTYLNTRSKGWVSAVQVRKQCWFNHLVRPRPDGRLEVYLVAFSEKPHRVILGGDYRLLLSADGKRVERFRSLHGGFIVIELKPGAADSPVVIHHIHRKREGELPTATDLLKLRHSPALRGLVVVGPRYTVYIERHPDKDVWSTRLLDSKKYRAMIRDPR